MAIYCPESVWAICIMNQSPNLNITQLRFYVTEQLFFVYLQGGLVFIQQVIFK